MSTNQITPERIRSCHNAKKVELWKAYVAAWDALESSRAEVRRLTEQVERFKTGAVRVSLDGKVYFEPYVQLLREEIIKLTEEARRSGAGRVEVPELTEEEALAIVREFAHEEEWPSDGVSEDFMDYIRWGLTIGMRYLASRLSSSPQPTTGADFEESHPIGTADSGYFRRELRSLLERIGNADGPWLARYLSRLAAVAEPSPQPSADVVMVPREEWERLQKFERDTKEADSRECSACSHYRRSQSCPGCTHPESPQNDYAFDWSMAQRCHLYALRSSTNHDAQDAGEGR